MRWWHIGIRNADLERELQSDLELEEEEQRENGASSEEALHAARRALGNTTLIREQTHEAWGLAAFERFAGDMRFAFRQLRTNAGFTAITVITLALGIGFSTAIFSVFSATLLRPLPFADPSRLVILWSSIPQIGYTGPGALTDPDFIQWQQQNQVFQQIAAFRGQTSNLTGSGEAERLRGATVTASLFPLLGVAPTIGRTFSAEEQIPGHANVVLISHKLWTRRFAGNPSVIGRTIELDDEQLTILGVMPPDFQFPNQPDFWTPLVLTAASSNATNEVIARLKPGITLARATEDGNIIQHRSKTNPHDEIRLNVAFLEKKAGADIRPTLNVLLAAVAVLLLIACANVANLFFARATARRHEITMRRALGASRGRIIRQLLTESLLLASFGGSLGLAIAVALGRALAALIPQSTSEPGLLNKVVHSDPDFRVLGFSIVITLATGILFGLLPAISVSNSSLLRATKGSTSTHTGDTATQRIRTALIVSEFALTLILLIAAGLLLNSFMRLLNVNPGFDAHNVALLNLELPESKYATAPQMDTFHNAVLDRIAGLPGVRATGTVAFGLPLGDGGIQGDFTIYGQPQPPVVASKLAISPGYFSALGVPLESGRTFNHDDTPQSQQVVIVSQSFARRFWPGKNALGQKINPGFKGTSWCTIIGIVGDVKQSGLASDAPLTIYLPYTQAPNFLKTFMTVVVRTDGNPLEMLHALEAAVLTVDPHVPAFNTASMSDLVALSISQPRLESLLLSAFAAFALVLAAVGIYGVISYSVTQRQREIAIRMALGAGRHRVMAMVAREGGILVLAGITLGLTGGLLASRMIAAMLFQVTPTDPATFAGVSILLGLVALGACYFPARRASNVDPMVTLRYD
jgi:putative ABC transport system permease protein